MLLCLLFKPFQAVAKENYSHITGVSIKTSDRRPVGPLTAICLDFINENKNDVNQKSKLTQRRTLKFLNATKRAQFLMPRSLEITFQASRFQIFLGGMPPDPPRRKGPHGPLSGHMYSRLLHLELPLITKVIKTPV